MTHICFPKKGPETPIFIVFFGCALSGPRCQKREILKSQQEKWKKLTDNWTANFWCFCCFWGGFCFSIFFSLFFLFLCFWPPHLALNPPYFFFLVFFFACFVFFNTKNLVFPPEKGIFCLFSVFLFLSPLAFFGLPVFLFLCLCFLFSSFLSFVFLVFPFCFLLVPCFCLFLSFFFLLCFFHGIKILNCKFCLHQYFLFFWFPVFFFSRSFFLSLLFPDFTLWFLLSIKVFDFQTNNLKKKKHFLVKKGVATKRVFFINLCFGKCQKLSFFLPFFWQFLGDVQKNYKSRYFSTFWRAKNWKKWPFLIVTNWATLIVTNWATFAQLKKRQRGPAGNY